MLRQVIIYKDSEKIYQQKFGKALDDESFDSVMKNIEKDAFKNAGETVQYYDFYKYRISYITDSDKKIIFLFTTDLSDKFENISKELSKCKKEFLLMFDGVLDHRFDKQTFDIFEPTIESIHKALRPKISLVGFSGVGKTTVTRLIKAEEIPTEHIPTITGDIATIKIGNLHFHLWDFAGQEQFSFLWNNFVKGSDAVMLISDSTLENCEKSKFFIDLIKKEAPNAHSAVIGNKQDLPDAMPIADIERMLGIKAYSMVATDPDNRNKMITIIADILEMSSEVSPLLKPLIDRDKKLKDAENALEAGNFQGAIDLFEDVADLCIELGDDVVSQEFHEKAEKIRKILSSVEAQGGSAAPAPAPAPAAPAPTVNAPVPAAPAPPTPTINKPAAPATPGAAAKSPSANLAKLNQMLKGMGGNMNLPKPKITASSPDSGIKAPSMNKPKISKPAVNTPAAPAAAAAPAPVETQGNSKAKLQAQVVDLEIKISNIKNKLVDLEMQNIMGDITDEEYKAKEDRMNALIANIQKRIDQIKSM